MNTGTRGPEPRRNTEQGRGTLPVRDVDALSSNNESIGAPEGLKKRIPSRVRRGKRSLVGTIKELVYELNFWFGKVS